MNIYKIKQEEELDYSDLLIAPAFSILNSRKEVCLETNYHFKYSDNSVLGVGIIASNMFTTGTFEIAKIMAKHKMFTCLHKHYTAEEIIHFLQQNSVEDPTLNDYIMISMGIRESDLLRNGLLLHCELCKFICLDVPNGYINSFISYVKGIRNMCKDRVTIAAGNVVDANATNALICAGADIVKVGIGGGSACTTRKITGVGRPMASTVLECAQMALNMGAMIIADGGIVDTGDISIAMGLGADFVMIGGMFAGTEEAGNGSYNIDPVTNRKYKNFYGMSSHFSQQEHIGRIEPYRTSEGRVCEIPYTGPLDVKLVEIENALRSTATYINAGNIRQFKDKATFYKTRHKLNNAFDRYEIK